MNDYFKRFYLLKLKFLIIWRLLNIERKW